MTLSLVFVVPGVVLSGQTKNPPPGQQEPVPGPPSDEKMTLHDLAEKYEISAERVRQIEKNAMKKVKQSIASGL